MGASAAAIFVLLSFGSFTGSHVSLVSLRSPKLQLLIPLDCSLGKRCSSNDPLEFDCRSFRFLPSVFQCVCGPVEDSPVSCSGFLLEKNKDLHFPLRNRYERIKKDGSSLSGYMINNAFQNSMALHSCDPSSQEVEVRRARSSKTSLTTDYV